ncbi:hypothetical protein EI545_17895 [Tabrizicola piscis]|uniref:Twin-arginine translocation signal domain-containing protein n=1 Tax=Tabrizicola piscis TaxID=2494374 RepID=A0A3S8UAB7_9RHOB|nr:hypothetical protein [Tabrizicola piscis]AZL60530.1 hypothetical protein EI545_17895 [Tabrizicola piscis]
MPSIPKPSLLLSRRDALIAASALAVGAAPMAASAVRGVPSTTRRSFTLFQLTGITPTKDTYHV